MFRKYGSRPFGIGRAIIPPLLAIVGLSTAVAWGKTDPFTLLIDRDYSYLLHDANKVDPSVPTIPLVNYTRASIISTQNNTPFIFLENLSSDPMLNFKIDLPAMTGDTSSIFHFVSPPNTSDPILLKTTNPSSVTVNASLASDANELNLDFGSDGLQTNQYVAFQVKFALDSCPSCGKPSFQVVLFDWCADGTPMGSPSSVTADYGGETPAYNGEWSNFVTSPYDEGRAAPLSKGSWGDMPMTSTFFPPAVPEPSAVLLGLVGICGLSLRRGSRRVRFHAACRIDA